MSKKVCIAKLVLKSMIFKEASEVAKSDVKFTGVNINAALAIIA